MFIVLEILIALAVVIGYVILFSNKCVYSAFSTETVNQSSPDYSSEWMAGLNADWLQSIPAWSNLPILEASVSPIEMSEAGLVVSRSVERVQFVSPNSSTRIVWTLDLCPDRPLFLPKGWFVSLVVPDAQG